MCNEKGTGKTTFALKQYRPYRYYTEGMLETSDFSNEINEDENQLTYCIIDSVDSIPESIFSEIMNKVRAENWGVIVLIFDVIKKHLSDCSNFNMIWECGLIPRKYKFSDYIASKENFNNFFRSNYPEIKPDSYDSILEITNYNFNKIDRLMLLQSLQTDNKGKLDSRALKKYVNEVLQIKFKDIPDANILLEKSSIIGERFMCDALESPDGFGYDTAAAYLKQMEEMHGFIRNCIDVVGQYEFVSHDVYQGILDGISSENRSAWLKILIQYYKTQYEHCDNSSDRFFFLSKLKNLFGLLPSLKEEEKSTSLLLLYGYRKEKKTYKALEIAKEIIEKGIFAANTVEYSFVQNFQIKTLIMNGDYHRALEILKDIMVSEKYLGSQMFIKYYYAFCLYQTGNVDLAYSIVIEIVEYLKISSGSSRHPQELFCMTYSLMATIQNHLGFEDCGLRYYELALNNALNKCRTDFLFYNILKKCDMFYDYPQTKKELKKCLNFYIQHNDWSSAGEVCTNLATEMLFQEGTDIKSIKCYFNNALNYFSEYHNEKLAYARNNLGIYYIIVENNIVKALQLFQGALFVGLSDFTYMNIYLNICMCYVLQDSYDSEEFEDSKQRFDFALKKLMKREHRSVYENVYGQLLEIILDEHRGIDIVQRCNTLLNSLKADSFFTPLLKDIIRRNRHESNCSYKDNAFYYENMNRLRIFFAEFRFWE